MVYKIYIVGLLLFLNGCDGSGFGSAGARKVGDGNYWVHSDCPGARGIGSIGIRNDNTVTGPYNENAFYTAEGATEYGFPSDRFVIMGPHRLRSGKEDDACEAIVYLSERFRNFVDSLLFLCRYDGSSDISCLISLDRKK